jgi:hypothetical protein
LTLALHRDEFYDVAAGDLPLLQEVVRALAKRLRALVAERPEEARVESEGVEEPEAEAEAERGKEAGTATAPVEDAPPPTPGATLAAAAVGRPLPEGETFATTPEPLVPPGENAPPEPPAPDEPPKSH